jgi:hypothetical protein
MPRQIVPGLIRLVGGARAFRYAEDRMRPLVPLFSVFTPEEAQALADVSIKNGQVWSASLCREKFLPEFIRIHGKNLKPETLRALQYQIEHHEWYNAGDAS